MNELKKENKSLKEIIKAKESQIDTLISTSINLLQEAADKQIENLILEDENKWLLEENKAIVRKTKLLLS